MDSRIKMLLHIVRKFAERIGMRIDSTRKRPYLNFIFIAGVDQQYFRVSN